MAASFWVFFINFTLQVFAGTPDCTTDTCSGVGTSGRCISPLSSNAYCECQSGYNNVPGDASACEPNDPCSPNPCPSSNKYTGVCSGIDFWNYECVCKGAYVHPTSGDKKTCTERDWCGEGGGCTGVEFAGTACINRQHTKECTCTAGYEHPTASDLDVCTDIDECATTNGCNTTNSVCNNLAGSYECICKGGWKRGTNTRSCIDINECVEGIDQKAVDIPCDPVSAECVNLPGAFTCNCYPGYGKADNFDALLPVGCRGCCVDQDECAAASLNHCSDYCANGIVHEPVGTNYTCGCWGGRYPTNYNICDDCAYGDWGQWSDCDVACGSGSQVRQRTPVVGRGAGVSTCIMPQYTTETGTCEMPRCITCSTTAWTEWSTCTASCGSGTHDRSRVILDGNATVCASTQTEETADCNTQSCAPLSVDKVALIVSSAVVGGFAIIGGAIVWKLRKRKGRRTNQDDDDGGVRYGGTPYGNLAPNYDLYAPQYL